MSRRRTLTKRELQILRLVASGCRYDTVAEKLGISSRTVGHHMGRIFIKFDALDKLEATIEALRNGSITLEQIPKREVLEENH